MIASSAVSHSRTDALPPVNWRETVANIVGVSIHAVPELFADSRAAMALLAWRDLAHRASGGRNSRVPGKLVTVAIMDLVAGYPWPVEPVFYAPAGQHKSSLVDPESWQRLIALHRVRYGDPTTEVFGHPIVKAAPWNDVPGCFMEAISESRLVVWPKREDIEAGLYERTRYVIRTTRYLRSGGVFKPASERDSVRTVPGWTRVESKREPKP